MLSKLLEPNRVKAALREGHMAYGLWLQPGVPIAVGGGYFGLGMGE